jgi:PAS domain S-box-containing protein
MPIHERILLLDPLRGRRIKMPDRSDPSFARSFLLYSKTASIAAILIGSSALLGWALDSSTLKSLLPERVAMNPATAVCFILSGLSLWLFQENRPGLGRRIAFGCAALVALVGGLKLIGYPLGWNFGADQWLFPAKLGEAGGDLPNRMAPNTALNFFLVGLALLLLDLETPRGRRPAQYLTLLAGLVSLLAVVGYAYSTPLYGVLSYIPMALNTALTFSLLCLGVLSARPNRGLMTIVTSDTAGGIMARRLLPAMIVIPLILGWVRLSGQRAGYYGTEFGTSLLTVSIVLIFGFLVWKISDALNRMEVGRRQAEEERDRFFNLSLDMLCIAGFDGFFKQLNPAWERTLGWTKEELLAKPYVEFIHPEDREPTAKEARRVSEGKDTISFENRYLCKDGSYRWLQWKGTPLMDRQMIYATSRDVTERKESEEKIKKLNTDLEHRTAQMEAANRELEAFSYSISHDLRAPLRAIDGFSLAVLEDCGERLDADGKDHLRRVRQATQRMAQLIDDILRLSRVSRGEMKRQQVDLSSAAEEIAAELRNSNPERRAEFIIQKGIAASGDKHLLRVVLGNLLDNAWKYTGKRPSSRIEFGAADQAGVPVYFVRDNGAGFDMAYADKLFGVFQRLHRPEEFPGTGVGLATVQRIIHRHGGKIWAEAAPENGATFYFTL